jgi:hypothetical protein
MSDTSLPTSSYGRRVSAPTSQESYRRPQMEAALGRRERGFALNLGASPRLQAVYQPTLGGPVKPPGVTMHGMNSRSCGLFRGLVMPADVSQGIATKSKL